MKKRIKRDLVPFAPGENTYGLGVVVETWRDDAGKIEKRWKYDLPDSVQVLGMTEGNEVIAIEESRGGTGPRYLHLVGETMEGDVSRPAPLEHILAEARRGLREETGYEGSHYMLLSSILENTGKSDRLIYFVLATGCRKLARCEAEIKVRLMAPRAFWGAMMAYFTTNRGAIHGGGNTLKLMALAYDALGLLTIKED